MASNQSPLPTSLAQGVRSSGPANAREAEATTRKPIGTDVPQRENESVDAVDSMATLGEGDVSHAVSRKSGTQLAEGQKREDVVFDDYSADLDR
jgi:hypothetical protein